MPIRPSNSLAARIARALLNSAVFVGALLVAWAFIELLLRLPFLDGFKDYEPTLRGGPIAYLPNQVTRHRLGNDFDTTIRINSQGFRDDEFDATQSRRTAVALGDSFTEGWGVDLADSWPKQLQSYLGQHGLEYAHIYNAGRSGTNPKNYASVYRAFFADDSNIDLVIVGICLSNDIIEENTPDERREVEMTLTQLIKLDALKYSRLYSLARRSLRYNPAIEKLAAAMGLTTPPEVPVDFRRSDFNSRRWPYTSQFLAQFAEDVQNTGKRVLVVLIPGKEQVMDDYLQLLSAHTETPMEDIDRFGFRDQLLRYLSDHRVDVLDLTSSFRDGGVSASDYYFRGDGHWNALGHRYAAERIGQHLLVRQDEQP